MALHLFDGSPLLFPPGSKYSYSSYGYTLLSAVIERAGGKPFAAQVAENIAKPLRLETLAYCCRESTTPNRAVGYREVDGRIVRFERTTWRTADSCWKHGGGAFMSSVEDLARFAAGLINGRLVSKAAEDLMWTRQRTALGELTPYGMGFLVKKKGRRLKASHSGSHSDATARLCLYPQNRVAAVAMCNARHVRPGAFTTCVFRAAKRRK